MKNLAGELGKKVVGKMDISRTRGDLFEKVCKVVSQVSFDFKSQENLFEVVLCVILKIVQKNDILNINKVVQSLEILKFDFIADKKISHFPSKVKKEFDRIMASLSFFSKEIGLSLLDVGQHANKYERSYCVVWPKELEINNFAQFLLFVRCVEKYKRDPQADFSVELKEMSQRGKKRKIIESRPDLGYFSGLNQTEKMVYIFYLLTLSEFSFISVDDVKERLKELNETAKAGAISSVVSRIYGKYSSAFLRERKKGQGLGFFYKRVKPISLKSLISAVSNVPIKKRKKRKSQIDKVCAIFYEQAIKKGASYETVWQALEENGAGISYKNITAYFSTIFNALAEQQKNTRKELFSIRKDVGGRKIVFLYTPSTFSVKKLIKIAKKYKADKLKNQKEQSKKPPEKVQNQKDLSQELPPMSTSRKPFFLDYSEYTIEVLGDVKIKTGPGAKVFISESGAVSLVAISASFEIKEDGSLKIGNASGMIEISVAEKSKE